MSITGANLRAKAKQLAQNGVGSNGTGVQLLLTDPGDYDEAIADALRVFDADRPNLRVHDYVASVAGFRFPLFGAGAVLPTTGLDTWIDGGSYVEDVWFAYSATEQGAAPLDRNTWRVVSDPTQDVLELIGTRIAVGQVLRLAYVVPHVVDETSAPATSVRAGDQRAIITLAASVILLVAAAKAVQNTGNTGLPNDVVDRRTQSDQFKSRAKDLRDIYNSLVGQAADVGPASGTKDLDVAASWRRPFLWHPDASH